MRLFRDRGNRRQAGPRVAFKAVRKYERAWAYGLAAALKQTRPITVWEVIMPVFLIITFARRKVDRDFLADNLLFTKYLALDSALSVLEGQRTPDTVRVSIESKTAGLLSTVGGSLYSEEIRKAQLQEIEYLMPHYGRLLDREGRDHAVLVRAAYVSKAAYMEFLGGLAVREKEVNLASIRTLGSRANPDFVAVMEEHSRRLRTSYADRVFGT